MAVESARSDLQTADPGRLDMEVSRAGETMMRAVAVFVGREVRGAAPRHYQPAALDRYEDLTGWKAPAAGGPRRRDLEDVRRGIDTAARLTIASELGHSRLEIARLYLAA